MLDLEPRQISVQAFRIVSAYWTEFAYRERVACATTELS
jgi:hypothetical protein